MSGVPHDGGDPPEEAPLVDCPILSRPDGTPIARWEDWSRPKKAHQWKEGRSAMELAKAWFRDGLPSPPNELMALLRSRQRLAGIRLVPGVPERITPLPVRGEGRNHDLWLLGRTPVEGVTVCVEAKADEPFGNATVSEHRDAALSRRRRGIPTGVPDRVDALLGIVGQPLAEWAGVRYQLLAAVCGTALQARADSSGCGVFVVHEFRTRLTTAENLKRNDGDYRTFLNVMGVPPGARLDGALLGPVNVGGVDCFFGKVVGHAVGRVGSGEAGGVARRPARASPASTRLPPCGHPGGCGIVLPMKGVLVRIGIDSTCGGWNAPLDPRTGRFAYVPIPEGDDACRTVSYLHRLNFERPR